MGEAEVSSNNIIIIHSHIITYGNAADDVLTKRIREEIETMWNEPKGIITLHGSSFQIVFRITAEIKKEIHELDILQNVNPRINYFRIEEYVNGNISFVDGIGCNTWHYVPQGNLSGCPVPVRSFKTRRSNRRNYASNVSQGFSKRHRSTETAQTFVP